MGELIQNLQNDIDDYRRRLANHADNVMWMIQMSDDWTTGEDIQQNYHIDLPFRQKADESLIQFADRISTSIDRFDISDYEKQLKYFRGYQDEESLENASSDMQYILQTSKDRISKDLLDIKNHEIANLKAQHEKFTKSSEEKTKARTRAD